jgi:pyruvate kinase
MTIFPLSDRAGCVTFPKRSTTCGCSMTIPPSLAALAEDLAALEAEIEQSGEAILARWAPRLNNPAFAEAARNLAQYLALRGDDRTALQRTLRAHGLSSLGRSDGHVLATLRAVRATVAGSDPAEPVLQALAEAPAALGVATEALFGPRPAARRTRIMVTLEPAAADPAALRRLVALGADIFRINCAHDSPADWAAMAGAAREAGKAEGRPVRLYMDLAGPKIRTADILPKAGIRVREGDTLLLRAMEGTLHPRTARASTRCTLPKAMDAVEPGAAVAFDDGKIQGRVVRRDTDGLWLSVERTRPGGARLKPDKGINFPDTVLDVPALTGADCAALDSVAGLADLVGLSFVQRAADMDTLHGELARRGAAPGVVAKVETGAAFRALPEIIVAGAGYGPFGLMIARGDLAVEIGVARLSEVQEEILWLAEAARVPVIWATEVLASLVKGGLPARGEVTDAAMGARAECVMLNKGPFQAEGVKLLDDLLRRAERHLDKKTPQLPRLRSWAGA